MYGRLRSYFQAAHKKQYAKELVVLKSIVEKDKSVLPGVIKYQDRGKMTFPHQALLPFMRKRSKVIKATLNCKHFRSVGRLAILTTKQQVLCNRELRDEFKGIALFSAGKANTETFNILYRDILWRVINTMANSLIQSQAMLARIECDKGVDAGMALRDKLKAYAIGKVSPIIS